MKWLKHTLRVWLGIEATLPPTPEVGSCLTVEDAIIKHSRWLGETVTRLTALSGEVAILKANLKKLTDQAPKKVSPAAPPVKM